MSDQRDDVPSLLSSLTPKAAIPREISRRLKEDDFQSVPHRLVPDMVSEGWLEVAPLKLKTKMRRPKAHDVMFEDRVWALFAKLGFVYMNRDRRFKLSYSEGSGGDKQIDVFAADDEVAFVVECRSTETSKAGQFKDEVEAIAGRRSGIIRTIKAQFPNAKVCFVLATRNYRLSEPSMQRLDAAKVFHMDEDSIEYYLEMSGHLGSAAKYQLLGAAFAKQKIPNLDTEVLAIRSKMGGKYYYTFTIEPERLLKLAFILHRHRANSGAPPTYQRIIKKARLKSVEQHVDAGGIFPNSILLNIDSGRGMSFSPAGRQSHNSAMGQLQLPQNFQSAYVIDGQHRLYGYANSSRSVTDLVPVVAFENLDEDEQVRLFMQINENQQAVPKNLRLTLEADLLWYSKDLRSQMRAVRSRVSQDLGEVKSRSLYGRIVVGENKPTPLCCITLESISKGIERGTFLGDFTKTSVTTPGTFFDVDNDKMRKSLADFLDLAFAYLRDELADQWSLGKLEGGFVFMNPGVEAVIRLLSDIVQYLSDSSPGFNARRLSAGKVFEEVEHYLNPAVKFLQNLDQREAKSLRTTYGSGGATQYWRTLQRAVHEVHADFDPKGLQEFLKLSSKEFNERSFAMVNDIEQFLNEDIKKRLQDEYGEENWFDQTPKKLRLRAGQTALEKNVDLVPAERVDEWSCLYLTDYQSIIIANHEQWQRIFARRYTRPGDEKLSGSFKNRADWISRLNGIRNKTHHLGQRGATGAAVSEDEFAFLDSIHAWLVRDKTNNTL